MKIITNYKFIVSWLIVIFIMTAISRENYLLFHGLSEVFSIVIAAIVFIIGWNAREYINNQYLIFISIAYLFIAILDTLHTLSFEGTGVFFDYDYYANQLWIVARYVESLSLLLAFLFIQKKTKLPVYRYLLIFSFVTIILLASIFVWHIFPECYVENIGLTSFKKYSEYIISLILIIDIILLRHYKQHFSKLVYKYMHYAIILTIFAELSFTLYVSNYGPLNLIGHYFKIFSFYAIYLAIVETGIKRPAELTHTKMLNSQHLLKKNRKELENKVQKLNCLYELAAIVERKDITLPEILQEIVNLIPKAWRFPKETCARLIIYGEEYTTNKCLCFFDNSGYDSNSEVFINGVIIGRITVRCMHTSCSSICFDGQEPENSLLQTIAIDLGRIIERHQAIEEIKKHSGELELRYRQMFESNIAIKLIVNPTTGRIVEANNSAVKFYGYDMETLTSMNIAEINTLSKKDLDEVMTLAQTNRQHLFSFKHKLITGEIRDVEVYSGPISVGDKTLLYSIIVDVTERTLLNAQLLQSDKMSALGQLVGGIAHDFNNNLAGIVGGAEVLKIKGDLDGDNKEILDNILTAAMNATNLTKQLLAFSRQNKTDKKEVDLKDITNSAVAILQQTIDPIISLDIEHTLDSLTVIADPAQLQAAILNICVNARDAVNSTIKPVIKIRTKQIHSNCDIPEQHNIFIGRNGFALISISNNGPHIPKELLSKILEPFFTTKEEGKGTGLGLAMVFSTIKSSTGHLFIDSYKDGDTIFSIYLPLTNDYIIRSDKASSYISKGTGKILFVDDDMTVRKNIGYAMRSFGYNVYECESGAKGIETFNKEDGEFDLIVTDVKMPDMTGIEFYRVLREKDCNVKFIIMSGHVGKDPLPDDVAEGIETMLIKPVSLKRLSTVINKALKK